MLGAMSLNWAPVAERVFVTAVAPHRVNVGLVVGEDSALLIDSGNTARQGAELRASAEGLAGVPVTHVVLTHDHFDHTDGLVGMGDVVSIGHENLTRVSPTARFSLARAIDLGGQRVEFLHFGPAHTSSDVIVFVPGAGVVFAGDLLEEGADPQIDETGSLANWPMVLDGILGAANAQTRFVPGHGAVVDRDFAFQQRAELAMVYGLAQDLVSRGVREAEARTATEWPFSGDEVGALIAKAYAELAAKGHLPRTQLPIMPLH